MTAEWPRSMIPKDDGNRGQGRQRKKHQPIAVTILSPQEVGNILPFGGAGAEDLGGIRREDDGAVAQEIQDDGEVPRVVPRPVLTNPPGGGREHPLGCDMVWVTCLSTSINTTNHQPHPNHCGAIGWRD